MVENEKARENARQIERELDTLRKLSTNHKYGEFWHHIKSVVGMFRTLRPLLSEDRERLWSAYSDVCEETKQGMAERRERTEQYAQRLEGKIEKAEDFISRLEDQISHLEGGEANALTDSDSERVREWMREREQKIGEVREQIREREDKLYSVKGRLG